ncbi:hypothetical protein [Chamaesiphon minutus]|uniref:Uncharacterized protein n=1 Tax=Chamaesiphon minutus (strain ATCC 27169 / PCC 6605) TaxID=1173020 RepID=K9UPK6_CHAP6|nr:hypothetical protein [Chamaesiphon minutus]AFY97022.1 hypothetical protein Cha6605_6192 [Chamaesiphon minutus PCC 6605]
MNLQTILTTHNDFPPIALTSRLSRITFPITRRRQPLYYNQLSAIGVRGRCYATIAHRLGDSTVHTNFI